jgi:hypothetical protein|tara:strand:+ start:119 stop:277 length:159 start_codon:yes stop_codon:yes gene_type:complete
MSVDEKPGIQAINNIAPALPTIPGKYSQTTRDYEYKRSSDCASMKIFKFANI